MQQFDRPAAPGGWDRRHHRKLVDVADVDHVQLGPELGITTYVNMPVADCRDAPSPFTCRVERASRTKPVGIAEVKYAQAALAREEVGEVSPDRKRSGAHERCNRSDARQHRGLSHVDNVHALVPHPNESPAVRHGDFPREAQRDRVSPRRERLRRVGDVQCVQTL